MKIRLVDNLYVNNGYLFFRAMPVETVVGNDSINVEIRIFEGPQATIDRVIIKGNDRTHEHVMPDVNCIRISGRIIQPGRCYAECTGIGKPGTFRSGANQAGRPLPNPGSRNG